MKRRQYVAGIGTTCLGGLAGCSGLFQRQASRAPPLVSDRPDAVYVPSHVEGMQMIGMGKAGRLQLALSYSFPHRFWLVNGDRTEKVDIASEDSVHLMVSVWDAETGRAVPSSNASVTVRKGGEHVLEGPLWPMISQNMGVHFGDNVALEGEGTYDVDVQFGPVTARRTGAFEGAFGEQATPSFEFEFQRSELESIMFERLDERKGERDAVDPMQMEMMPVPQLPPVADLPGSVLGEGTGGDATLAVTTLSERPTGVDGSGPYLAVSARTPYNRFALPLTSLSATVSRGDGSTDVGQLTPTLDPDLGYHYGAALDSSDPVESVTITPETPSQMSRHEGYETAFLDTSSVTVDSA